MRCLKVTFSRSTSANLKSTQIFKLNSFLDKLCFLSYYFKDTTQTLPLRPSYWYSILCSCLYSVHTYLQLYCYLQWNIISFRTRTILLFVFPASSALSCTYQKPIRTVTVPRDIQLNDIIALLDLKPQQELREISFCWQ